MKRKVVVCLFGCLLCFAGVSKAQSYPRFDLSTSYAFLHSDPSRSPGIGALTLNGGGVSLGYSANRWLSAVVDVSGYAGSNVVLECVLTGCPSAATSSTTMWTYLAGPRFNFRRSKRVTPYAQVLAGFARGSGLYTPGPQRSFALSVGGGLDVRITDHFSLRPVQADYLMTHLNEFSGHATQADLRLSSGLAVHFLTNPGHLSCLPKVSATEFNLKSGPRIRNQVRGPSFSAYSAFSLVKSPLDSNAKSPDSNNPEVPIDNSANLRYPAT